MRRLTKYRRHLFIAVALVFAAAVQASGEEIVLPAPKDSGQTGKQATQKLTLCIEDVQGSYTIPYIQSDRSLDVRIESDNSEGICPF